MLLIPHFGSTFPPLGGGGAPPVVTDKKKKSAVLDGALRLITAVSLLHQVKAMPCEGAAVVRRMPLTRGREISTGISSCLSGVVLALQFGTARAEGERRTV